MGNRIIAGVLLLLAVFMLFTGCGTGNSSSQTNSYYDEDGNFVIESDGRRTVMPDELPYDIPYNGKSLSVKQVSFYQNVPNYSYNLFIIVRLDVSDLDDASIHWLQEDDLTVNAYITNEANGCDFESASPLGSLLLEDKKELIYVATTSFYTKHRYGFENSELSISVTAKQADTYDYKNSDGEMVKLHKEECMTYITTTGDTIKDTERIEQPLYQYITKWLNSKADAISDLYD